VLLVPARDLARARRAPGEAAKSASSMAQATSSTTPASATRWWSRSRIWRRDNDQGARHVLKPNLAPLKVDVLASWHPRQDGDAQHKWLREWLVSVL